jgi:hypothetical protein
MNVVVFRMKLILVTVVLKLRFKNKKDDKELNTKSSKDLELLLM